MSLSLSLNNALTGLRVNQQAISVLSQNIANVNTEGYSRQLIEQNAQYVQGVGAGVRIDDVIRKVDKYLQRAVQTQGSQLNSATAIHDYYNRVQVLLGAPGSQNSLDEFMSTFFGALQRLGETPERTSFRNSAVDAGVLLSNEISGLAFSLQDLRFEADREIRETTDAVNETLYELQGINLALVRAATSNQSTAGLLDARDQALVKLSGYMDVTTFFDNTGAVNVIVGNGIALLDDTVHELRYSPVQSVQNLVNDTPMNALQVVTLDAAGNLLPNPSVLFSAETNGVVTSTLSGGRLEGLRLMRDEVLPGMLDQLDTLAANLRDALNAIHNDGSGFPPPNSLTGTRAVSASDSYNWSGSVRIAVLQSDGTPVPAGYTDELYTGIRPLTLNFAEINTSDTDGRVSVQAIMDEINNHFGPPGAKAEVGVLNNIQLVADTNSLPSTLFRFDFDLDNISGSDGDFFVTNVTVRDDTAADITNITERAPTITLNPTATYVTTNGSSTVGINLQSTSGLAVGDTIYLGPPGTADVNGILAADITGYFTIQSITGNQIGITANDTATSGGTVADASGVILHPPWERVAAGEKTRTIDEGEMEVNLSGNSTSDYYDITVDVGVVDEDGNIVTSQVTYRITNSTTNLLNDRYHTTAVAGGGTRVIPNSSASSMRAMLVDENGDELFSSSGDFVPGDAYLKLVGANSSYTIAIDELDSMQLGNIDDGIAGTNRGFSHFFELNNFFVSNEPTSTGDTVHNSAVNLRVEQRLIDNPNLITTGDLVLSTQSNGEGAIPLWTYVRHAGDNQLAARLAGLSSTTLQFAAAGGLPAIDFTLQGYTSEMLGFIASNTSSAEDDVNNATVLYEGFKTRAEGVSAVNLDEELANTVIFQNAYSATARIITVVNAMFEDLIGIIG